MSASASTPPWSPRSRGRAQLGRTAGQAIFVYAAFDTWFRHYGRSRPRFRVEGADGAQVDGFLTIRLSTNPYTYFGFPAFRRGARRDRGTGLTAVTLRRFIVGTLLGVTARASARPRMWRAGC